MKSKLHKNIPFSEKLVNYVRILTKKQASDLVVSLKKCNFARETG
jgi:hypothetical protein